MDNSSKQSIPATGFQFKQHEKNKLVYMEIGEREFQKKTSGLIDGNINLIVCTPVFSCRDLWESMGWQSY
jgi:hypothetical protein